MPHDWNAKQHPETKAKEHGKKDQAHGPHEHGQGGVRDPNEPGPKQSPDDLTILEPDDEPLTGATLAGVTASSSSFYIAWPPPVTDQRNSPRCVAHSNAYDQNQHDRRELGRFVDFDQAKFFIEIDGHDPGGAYLINGLRRRRDFGYPEQDSTPQRSRHQIADFTNLPRTVSAIKEALLRNHGVLFIGDWFHSWHHPLASGKLPAPDYRTGGHAFWIRGWNDNYGFRLRNSWGTDWGLNGDAFYPYAFLSRLYSAYRTTDKPT